MKRILIVEPDGLVANFHRELFQASGFNVEVAANPELSQAAIAHAPPDTVLLDAVYPATDLVDQLLKCVTVPLIVLRSAPADSVRKSSPPSVRFLEDNSNSSVTTAVHEALNFTSGATSLSPGDEAGWARSMTGATPESLSIMRDGLRRVFKSPRDTAALFEIFRMAHFFAVRAAAIERPGARRVAAAFEALMWELYQAPELVNTSTLRTAGQATDALASLLKEEGSQGSEALENAQVLAVEDDDDAGNLIGRALNLVQLKSSSAKNADEALLKLAGRHFDLLLFDLGLPGLDGFELCSKVRTLPEYEKTPVIFITGMATFDNRVQSSLRGGNDFIAKPFDLQELGLKVLLWLMRTRPELQAAAA